MNWRATGCGVIAAAVFIGIGIWGLNLATGKVGCPSEIGWQGLAYAPVGAPAPSPAFAEVGNPVKLGSTFIGLTTRDVYGPPGSRPTASAAQRPKTIAMDCGDGTFLTYRRTGTIPTATPGASP